MTKPHLAAVSTLYATNASDIPGMLRQSADTIASETDDDDRTKAMIAVQVSHDGAVAVKDRNVAAAKQTQAATDSVSGVTPEQGG